MARLLAVVGALVVLVIYLITESVQSDFRAQRRELGLLLASRVTLSELTNHIGYGQILSKGRALQVTHQLALQKDDAVAKASKYPQTMFFLRSANMTVFVFLDESGRMVDYAMGGQ